VRLHTLLDLRGNIPSFVHISDGKLNEVNVLDEIAFEPGSFYIMDRGFLDFTRLHTLHLAQAFFVIRAKSNMRYRRMYSHAIDKACGLRCDQTIVLTGQFSSSDYPAQLRRVKFYDAKHDKLLVFLTNNFQLPALTVAQLYRCRWQVELFFKWIKQHLRIKAFLGTSENAVKTQVWIAITVYVLVAIVKKRLQLPASLYTLLQILSVTLFEKVPLAQVLAATEETTEASADTNQLNLFA
jgi:transposase